jgi:cysteine sulfinate desulfinase/cysteine desulfurase-like protein
MKRDAAASRQMIRFSPGTANTAAEIKNALGAAGQTMKQA